MMRAAFIISALFFTAFLSFTAQAETAQENIQGKPLLLSKPSEISDISNVKTHFSTAVTSMRQCANGDASRRETCYCSSENQWHNFSSAFKALLDKYPSWDGRFIEYNESPLKSTSISINAWHNVVKSNSHIQCQ